MKAKNKWRKKSSREKIGIILSGLVLSCVLLLYLLYFLGILDHSAKTFAWALFPFLFFFLAFGQWNVRRTEARRQLFLGGFVSIFSILMLLGYLMTKL